MKQALVVFGLLGLVGTAAPAATWNVSTSAELVNAVNNYAPGDEIVLAAGTYSTGYLQLDTNDVIVRGATGNPDDVIVQGPGMNVNSHPREGLLVEADDITIMDLTIRDFFHHGIHIRAENDADRAWISNVRTVDCGERHIKGSYNAAAPQNVSDDCVIELVVMEQTQPLTNHNDNDYIGGIDCMGIHNVLVRDCVALNIQGATGGGRGGIFLWNAVTNPTVERNRIYGCDRGIAFGNPGYSGTYCVEGGILRNNFVTRGSGIALELCFLKDVKVYHNSVYSADASYFRTVHIYDSAGQTANLHLAYNIIRGQILDNATGDWTSTGNLTGSVPQAGWFVDPAVGNLHLTAGATAAIDAAAPLAEVTEDFDKESRGSSPDVGADEYQGAALPVVTLSATDPNAAEQAQDTGTFTVSRDQTSGNLTVSYSVGGTASAGDYEESLTGSVTIPDGQASATITITPVDDSEVEADETVQLTLSADAAYSIGSPNSGTVTIADNDVALPVVTLSATDPNAAEQAQDTGTFTVSRDQTSGNLTVSYSVGGTASAGDYEESLTGSVTIPDGQASATITITPVDDSEVEADETVQLTLSADAAYSVGSPNSGTVTIADNDTEGPTDDVATGETPVKGTVAGSYTGTHTSDDVYESVTETHSGGKPSNRYSTLEHRWTFNVTGGSSVTFHVEAYQTASSDGDHFLFQYSTNGSDWTDMVTVSKTSDDDASQAFSLPASTAGTVYVRVIDTDRTPGHNVYDTVHVDHMFIRSQDGGPGLPTVSITATDPDAAEQGPDAGAFTVSRSQSSGELVVHYTVSGTASGADYVEALTGQVTLPDGQASAVITVTPVDDAQPEADETVTLALAGDASYHVGSPSSATVTIADNDTVGPETLFSDGFESGGFAAGGWVPSGSASVTGRAAYAGSYGAMVSGAASITKALSTVGYADIHVKFQRKTKGLDAGEYLYCEWSDDGGQTWHELGTTQATAWAREDFACPAGAAGNADFQVRFRTNANKTNEYGYVDEVEITGAAQ